jgi:SAM-dependent methyltransferase
MQFDRYDRIVSHYAAMWPMLVPGYVPILSAMLDVVLAHAKPPRRILDIGCGPASAVIAIAPGCDVSAEVTLVDGSAAMLAAARTVLARQTKSALVGDFSQPEIAQQVFAPAIYDLVVCSFALHHLADPTKRDVLSRCGEALSVGGLLLVADEVVADRPGGWDLVERMRGRYIQNNLAAGRITNDFWKIETTLPKSLRLPFLPARIDDLSSWVARAGLAVSCPLHSFGSALLVGVKR